MCFLKSFCLEKNSEFWKLNDDIYIEIEKWLRVRKWRTGRPGLKFLFFFLTNNCVTFTKSLLWACFLTCKTCVHTCIHTHQFQMASKTTEWDNKVKALAQFLALSNYSVLFHWICYFWLWYLLTITKLLQGRINGIGLKLMKSEKASTERGTEVEKLDEKLVSRGYLALKPSSLLKL